MGRVHGIIDERLKERARSAEHFLLRSGASEKTAAGLYAVGEVQRQRAQSFVHEPACRSERRFIRDLNACVFELSSLAVWKCGIRSNTLLRRAGGHHSITPADPMTVARFVEALMGGFQGGAPKRRSNVSGDAQLESTRLGQLIGIEAGQEV